MLSVPTTALEEVCFMSRTVTLSVLALALSACTNSWDPVDHDGDGISALEGDCWDAEAGPEGSGLSGAEIFPGATETFYDGIDQDCGGDDDYDADGDGYVPDEYFGLTTLLAPGTGELPAGDCWDDPSAVPAAYAVVSSDYADKDGTAVNWEQPEAAEVNPDGTDLWYDGVDQDCAGDSDFDKDGDGFDTESYPQQDGSYGDDCVDGNDLDDDNFAGDAAIDINPDATEEWYDGTDQNCDDNDCDQDEDGFDGPTDGSPTDYCVPAECDDDNSAIYPDDSIPEVWYNGIDENCDGDDGDQDDDGYWVDDYEDRVLASGSGVDPLDIPEGYDGDCWDVPSSVGGYPPAYAAVNDIDQPESDAVNPQATQVWYDDVDQDCGGDSDFDQDADGYDTLEYSDRAGVTGTDCDDIDGTVFPGQFETFYDGTDDNCDGNDGDADGDGYWDADYDALVTAAGGTPLEVPSTCGTIGALSCEGDCDDGNDQVHPNRLEDCGTDYDDDCDGDTNFDSVDEPGTPGDAIGCTDFWEDADRDNYGDITGAAICYCEAYGNYDVTEHTDCDDTDDDTYPGADEYCDGHDDDCDGEVDEDASVDVSTWYADTDGDGYGDATSSDIDCYVPTGYVADNTDCDDDDANDYPGATETGGNEDDEDCDGAEICYHDDDDDGYLDSSGDTIASADVDCTDAFEGTDSTLTTDCDDSSASVYPGATEIVADGIDQDCANGDTCYEDGDLDGYGDSGLQVSVDLDCTDAGESSVSTDCDDANAAAYPGATEIVADGVDQSCSGGDTCYDDGDLDGYGTVSTVLSADLDCSDSGESSLSTDCDDSAIGVYPGAAETVADGIDQSCSGGDTCYVDADNDDYGTTSTVASSDLDCTDSGEASVDTDCDDSDDAQYPGADEYCNGEDDDCDGTTDEASAVDVATWYLDYDGDGYGDDSMTDDACSAPTGYVADDTDCDDTASGINPGATEICDSIDNDCDGDIDDDDANLDASTGSTWYDDGDGDGYGDAADTALTCDVPSGHVANDDDCDDTDGAIKPGATEVCDDVDNDCDGDIDDADAGLDTSTADTWYVDSDGDGQGSSSSSTLACDQPSGYAATDTDCDDSAELVYLGATEYCGTIDFDCDSLIGNLDSDASDATTWYGDLDGDGYGDPAEALDACLQPTYYVSDSSDCLDTDEDVYPGALEVCDDGVINDCNETGGGTAGNTCPAVGDLVINEVMCDTALVVDTAGEWIEIYNATGADIDLEGLMLLDDGSDSHQITSSVVVPAGDYAVLAIDADASPVVDYVYSGYTLANSVDEVIIATYGTDGTDGTEIDRVDYGSTWPNNDGNAMALDVGAQNATDNDDVGNWAAAECVYDLDNSVDPVEFEQGSPGDDNDLACPAIAQVDPSEIELAGGDTVTITGSDFDYGSGSVMVTVGVWGVDSEITPSSTASTEVEFTAPGSSDAGSDFVVLDNGKYLSWLEDGLNWVETDVAYIWWPIPSTHATYGRDYVEDSGGGTSLEAGETTEDIYGRFYHVGVGDCTTEPTDYTVELGYGDQDSDPRYDGSWTWLSTTFNGSPMSCTTGHSEYYASIGSLVAGDYSFTFRYSYDGGPWVYGEFRGDYPFTDTQGPSGYAPGEILDIGQMGSFTVN